MTELEALKRALIIANLPAFGKKIYPEIFGEEENSDIDQVVDTMSNEQDGISTASPEIEFDLVAPSSDEARRVANLLADQHGTIR